MVKNFIRTRVDAVERGGFTLLEVIVAMFLLAIVATGLIPALVGTLKLSSQNTTIATASQLVAQQIDIARSGTATCSALTSYQAVVIPPVVDARGVSYQPIRNSVTCTAGASGIATVNVSVTLTGKSQVLASAVTYVYITS
jgi:prepilin-type N-terminal cleavage/methylation domain-containing protein